MISTSLLRFLLITTIFYVMLGLLTFHFFSSLFIFTLIFSIGCVCFISYREEKEKDLHIKKEHGCVSGDPQIGGAETFSEEILGIILLFLFWGITSGMSQVKNELQKSINKISIFLVLLLVALTGLGLGWFLELRISNF
jgi:hypothetical protein